MFLANFLIALREGVEASLIVGILVGVLTKLGRRDMLPAMWLGVSIAIVVPFGAGAMMIWGPYTLSFQAQEILGGGLSIIAAAFVTWMIFWMARHSREEGQSVAISATQAAERNSAATIVWIAVLSVGREGVETALFVWGVVKSSATTSVIQPTAGVFTGILGAVLIGVLIYRGSRAINLKLFFTITGYLLVVVAAGIIMYGIGDLQEASVLPGWGTTIYSATDFLASYAGTWWFVLLNAFFNLEYLLNPTWLQLTGYLLYLIPALVAFAIRTRPAPRQLSRPACHPTETGAALTVLPSTSERSDS